MAAKKTFVIGHKNPDTDSICSAISYAYLKNQLAEDGEMFVPKRAGEINEETKYVLKRFQVKAPEYVSDVSTQVRDIEIRKTKGVDRTISLKEAWNLMKENGSVTLPIVRAKHLEGVITTEDIAKAYMDVYDNRILSTAHTKYSNIVKTIDGNLIVGEQEAYFTKGKVLIAAANPDIMEEYIEPGDLVILGNRYETQLCAIEMEAGCIVICDGVKVSKTIQSLAADHNCTVISTPHDTFTVARLINQSMPISYFMCREDLITFKLEDFTENIKNVMAKKRHRYFPILNKKGEYVGMMSRRNLLNAEKKRIILVDHNEKNQAVDGMEEAQILEIIDHHRLGTVETLTPIYVRNQPLGCTATIIYQLFQERGVTIPKTIASLLLSAIVSDTLMFRSPTCTEVDKRVAEDLANIAEVEVTELAGEMFKAGSNLSSKSAEEIFYQDFKKFSVDGVNFGIGQISFMSHGEQEEIKQKMRSYLEKTGKIDGIETIYFMLTNILDETSEVIYIGEQAEALMEEAFGIKSENKQFTLNGVVSRKKQLLPKLMTAIQN